MVFVMRFGLYKFTVLLFGLYNAFSTFQRLMNHVFSNILDQYILFYLDDILLYSETTTNHVKHLNEVFPQLCAHKLQEKYAK